MEMPPPIKDSETDSGSGRSNSGFRVAHVNVDLIHPRLFGAEANWFCRGGGRTWGQVRTDLHGL